MPQSFNAQSLAQTRLADDQRTFELTFVDHQGETQGVSIPVRVAADLAEVLASLAESLGPSGGARFTKVPKAWAVGRAQYERLVLIRFDDDPPYGLDLDEAAGLWREVREETEFVSRLKEPARQ
jgi:hypothetical protein